MNDANAVTSRYGSSFAINESTALAPRSAAMTEKIEYRVRPVTRYIVTRYHSKDENGNGEGGSRQIGEFDNPTTAYATGYACCKVEHDRLGWPPGDERIQYPEAPAGVAYDEIRL